MQPMLALSANAQANDELRRQALLSNRVEMRRWLLTLIPFAVGSVFLSPLLCLLLAALNLALEWLGLRLLNDTDPGRQPLRYKAMLGLYVASSLVYCLIPVLALQVDVPFSKAFAMGMLMFNIVLVAAVRTVHLPLALGELLATASLATAGNTWYWVVRGDLVGLAISSVCLVAGLYSALTLIRALHKVHSETALESQIAQSANAAKSRVLAQMSHELRTPLNAILSMGYAEQTYATTPEAKERLTTLVESARGLLVMLDDILDLSAIDAGQLLIRPKMVDLHAEITSTLALFRQQLLDAKLDLRVTLPPDLPELVMIDRQRFRQCLSNILSNAIKYTTVGSITIEAKTVASNLLAPDLLVIEISDTGPGVPTALHEHIFEPFGRGSAVVAGTGLGLSISRTLARRMGGDLHLLPSITGARFRLTVAILPAPTATHAPEGPVPALPSAPVDLAKRRVLVVDDLATNRLVAVTYLKIMGAVPQAVESGLKALDVIAAHPPDIVLLDMLMEGMDGMETFLRIRALPGAAGRTAVIAMTADASEDRRRTCLAAGFDGFVTKPISPELLGAAMQAVIARGPTESDTVRRK